MHCHVPKSLSGVLTDTSFDKVAVPNMQKSTDNLSTFLPLWQLLGIGVDELVKRGMLDKCKEGPLYWLDTADSQPCIGTGGIAAWQLTAHGKLFHSGLPHKSINPIELAMDAVTEIQRRFYEDFPPHPEEERYGFATCSTLKPTQWSYPSGSINQIPGSATVCGDCRITPFYDVEQVMSKIRVYVDDINANPNALARGQRGPYSKYELPDEGLKGRVDLKFFENVGKGVSEEHFCCLGSMLPAGSGVAGHLAAIVGSRAMQHQLARQLVNLELN
eukprot:GHUV01039313.1.p1 GENE.GHUV01039313.1~~GHUV01039313.1.p1  ORF type:complete len:274 (+),score=69.27 GHUV01039313.1:523-1344(+)